MMNKEKKVNDDGRCDGAYHQELAGLLVCFVLSQDAESDSEEWRKVNGRVAQWQTAL